MVSELYQKYAFIVVLLILILVFVFWFMGQYQNLPMQYIGKGEKGRFMRYLSCAAAMCGAWDYAGGVSDGCLSTQVLSQGLEYDGESLRKGCRDLCIELRENAGVGPQNYYCGNQHAFTFTFQEYVNFTSLDIRNFASFYNRVIHQSCYVCPISDLIRIGIADKFIPGLKYLIMPLWGHLLSEGYLLTYTAGACGERPGIYARYPGVIWVSSTVASECFGSTTDTPNVDSYAYCAFDAGDIVTIYPGPEPPHSQKYWEWTSGSWVPYIGGALFTSCGFRADLCINAGLGCVYTCPQIFVC